MKEKKYVGAVTVKGKQIACISCLKEREELYYWETRISVRDAREKGYTCIYCGELLTPKHTKGAVLKFLV
jgi:uncharacterized protein involved in tolerance to divalent cations